MSQELKPCAHCGGEAYIHHPFSTLDRKGLFPSCFVKCKSCMLSTHYSQSEAEAIAAWNRRAQPERKQMTDIQANEILCRMSEHVDDWADRLAEEPSIEECSGEALRFILAALPK